MSNPVGQDRHMVGTHLVHMGELTVEAIRRLVVDRQHNNRANGISMGDSCMVVI